VGLLAKFGHLPRFIVRCLTPTVSRATPENDVERQHIARVLITHGRSLQSQEARPKEVRRIHPITVMERESAIGRSNLRRLRAVKPSDSDEAA
jgi:hypothetical protein